MFELVGAVKILGFIARKYRGGIKHGLFERVMLIQQQELD